MLAEKEIGELIDKKYSSLRIVKPTITPKSSAVWNSFNCIYVNDIKQEYVICNQFEDLFVYKFVIECKPGLKLKLDMDPDPDPDPTKTKFSDPDPDPVGSGSGPGLEGPAAL
jgi:hypothetical protein